MARVRRRPARAVRAADLPLLLALALALAPGGAGWASAAEGPSASRSDGLHDRPVLVVDPGAHTAPVRRLDADREGRFLVTASLDKTVRVWDAAAGRLLRTLRLPAGPGDVGKARAAAVSPDGALVAAGGFTGAPGGEESVYLFDRASGRLLRRVGGLPDVVAHLAFSPDGARLAATLRSGGVRLIDPARGRVVAADGGYGDRSNGAAFDPASGRLATTSYDGKVRLYDPGLRLLREAEAPDGAWPLGIAFSPDGGRLAVGYRDATAVDVLDGATLEFLFSADTAGVDNGDLSEVAWSADGGILHAAGRWNVGGEHRLRRWAEGGRGGRGAPADLPLSRDTVESLRVLPGKRLAFAAQDPRLGLLSADGGEAWSVGPAKADLRGQRGVLAASADGARVRFGHEYGGVTPAVFSLPALRLEPGGRDEGLATARTGAPGLAVQGWINGYAPTLNGIPLALDRHEQARSLAVAPDGGRFVLGADSSLRMLSREGEELWRRAVPGVAWAVVVSGDGRLIVAAYGDGTIRWHKLEDGAELLAFMPLADRANWVAWTPEGFHAATPGALGVLRWHVDRGRDEAPEDFPVSEIPQLRRPDVLPLVLQELDLVRALGLAEMAQARRAVQARARTAVSPGAQLHVLAVGVGDYNEGRAAHLRLRFAARDAWDLASALLGTQDGLYAAVRPQVLRDREATRTGIADALAAMRAGMAAGAGRDLAVVHFSGHGAMVDGRLYLLPHEVDARTPSRIKGSALAADELRAELVGLGAHGRVLVLLDACRSGAATAEGAGVAADATLLRAALAAANVTVLTSSSGAEASREDEAWGHGAFTHAFLEGLGGAADADRDGLVGVTELAGYLARRVPALTGGAQTPGIEVRFEGGLFAAGM